MRAWKGFLSRILNKLLFLTLFAAASGGEKCNPRKYNQNSIVCVCNADYCDKIGPLERPAKRQYLVYTSDKEGNRFEKTSKPFSSVTKDSESLQVNRNNRYQEIIGFGGAFTDSTGININSLDAKAKSHLMQSYFSEDGIEYSMGRVPIGGTDFSIHEYSYMDDDEGNVKNFSARNFTLASEDFDYKIPLMKEAEKLRGRTLKLFGSAWIAPKAWITTKTYSGWGFLREKYFQDWADYFIRFLELYEKEGFHFWGITTGNEPTNYIVNLIPTVPYFLNQQMKWINNNIGPTLRKSKFSNTKLIALDDQTLYLANLDSQLRNNVTNQFVDGACVHWYFDAITPSSIVSNFNKHYPDKFIFNSEACIIDIGVHLGKWENGESYANSIMDDLLNGLGGWVDWNMALNLNGGPANIENFANSPIIVNASAGEFYKQPMYYALGHFSKFLPEKSVRIAVDKSRDLKVVAFERPDNGTVIIVLNNNDRAISLKLVDETHGEIDHEISPKSFNTIVYW